MIETILYILVLLLLGQSSCTEEEATLKVCEGNLNTISRKPFFSKFAERFFDGYNNHWGFVLSDIKVRHRLIQLLTVGSENVKSAIKKYLGLPADSKCDKYYCKAFKNIMNQITTNQAGGVVFTSFLYGRNKEMLKSGVFDDCFTNILDKTDNLNEVLDSARGIDQWDRRFIKTYFNNLNNTENDFVMLSDVFVKAEAVKPYTYITNDMWFQGFDQIYNVIDWVKQEGTFWVGTKHDGTYWYPSKTRLYRTELNGGKLLMLYFQPVIGINDMEVEKAKHFKKIFANLGTYITEAATKYAWSPYVFHEQYIPTINLKTEVSLEALLQDELPVIFQSDQIQNLFKEKKTLIEQKTFDYFLNRDDMDFIATQIRRKNNDGYLDTPFIFVLIDKTSSIILKTGTFLREGFYHNPYYKGSLIDDL